MSNTVKATTHWVWTAKAEKANPKRAKAGGIVWEHCTKEAPEKWLKEGLIIDSSEYVAEGQTDIFDFIEG
ncbi:hypothetical protein D3C74_264590 [compost metagenome]